MIHLGSQKTRFAVFTFVLLLATITGSTPIMSCEASRGTVKYVDRCPQNESEWFESAKKKNCSGITQNCSKTDFVYHCLINSWENATVEVCALRKNIIGKCAEYNAKGAVVQEHHHTDCKSCPPFYRSNEAYLYQECYDIVTAKEKTTTISATNGINILAADETVNCIIIAVLFIRLVIRYILI